jgi:hypothetical protein
MPLPEPTSARRRLHTRSIELEGFLREDGCFDLEAVLVDRKDSDYRILSGVRRAGEAVHEMRLRFTVDRKFNVLAVEAASDAVPYAGHCDTIGPAYGSLVGLNLFNGFRKAALERVGEVNGCTHLTELLWVMPTLALQTLATLVPEDDMSGQKPFQLDRCHALDSRGEAVRIYYPRWFVGGNGAAPEAPPENP